MLSRNETEMRGQSVAMRINPVLAWDEAFAAGPDICGGKGYNLGRLHRYGFRVPRGGVVPAAWYQEVLAMTPAGPRAFVCSAPAECAMEPDVLAALAEIRDALESAEFPGEFKTSLAAFLEQQQIREGRVAVRSSATAEDGARASFAGIHRSFLNVSGLDAVLRSILGCYASLWTPQALAYRRKMNFADDEVLCAVVICAMVHAEAAQEPLCAGVAFSFDPVSGRRDLVVIDAAQGMGRRWSAGLSSPSGLSSAIARAGSISIRIPEGPLCCRPSVSGNSRIRFSGCTGTSEMGRILKMSNRRTTAVTSGFYRCGRRRRRNAFCPRRWRRYRAIGRPPTSRSSPNTPAQTLPLRFQPNPLKINRTGHRIIGARVDRHIGNAYGGHTGRRADLALVVGS